MLIPQPPSVGSPIITGAVAPFTVTEPPIVLLHTRIGPEELALIEPVRVEFSTSTEPPGWTVIPPVICALTTHIEPVTTIVPTWLPVMVVPHATLYEIVAAL